METGISDIQKNEQGNFDLTFCTYPNCEDFLTLTIDERTALDITQYFHDILLEGKRKIPINVLLNSYGWDIKTDKEQKYGSPADIYAENDTYFMRIDDGNVFAYDTIYHIYNISIEHKIFEGRLLYMDDFKKIMKFLGFTQKIKIT